MSLRIGSICLKLNQHRPFEALSNRIARMGADVLLISGFRTGMRGMMLRAGLDRLGMVYQTPSDTEPEVEALILASRCPFLQVEASDDLAGHQFLHVCIGDFHLFGCDLSGHASPSTLAPLVLAQVQGLQRDKLIFFSRYPEDSQVTSEQSASSCPETGDTLATALTHLGFVDAYKLHPQPCGKKLPPRERPPFNTLVTPALAPQLSQCFQDSAPSDTQAIHTAVLKMG
jgi:hypothetical protein